jgi:hypothetical protein
MEQASHIPHTLEAATRGNRFCLPPVADSVVDAEVERDCGDVGLAQNTADSKQMLVRPNSTALLEQTKAAHAEGTDLTFW